MLTEVELMSDLIRILNQTNSRLIQPDFEEFDELPNEAKHFILEDVGSDGTTAVDEEDEVRFLFGAGGLDGADTAWREVGG